MMKRNEFTRNEWKNMVYEFNFEKNDLEDMIKIYEDDERKVFGIDNSIFIIDKKKEEIVDWYEDERLYFIEYGIDEIDDDEVCYELEEIREELKIKFGKKSLVEENELKMKKNKEFNYEELKKLCNEDKLKDVSSLVSYLIGRNDYIDVDDWSKIMELRYNGVIE